MRDYEVGRGKPPKNSQFKPGVSGNPKGRKKRKPSALAEIIRNVLNAPISYSERGRIKWITWHELILKELIQRAVNGNLSAAELVLKFRVQAQRLGEAGVDWLQISDWLPDYPGQTAEQKTQEFTAGGDADPIAWWQKAGENKATDRMNGRKGGT
jgi:Family of unknown function (DUF5681)